LSKILSPLLTLPLEFEFKNTAFYDRTCGMWVTDERLWILQFFGAPCRKYYLLT